MFSFTTIYFNILPSLNTVVYCTVRRKKYSCKTLPISTQQNQKVHLHSNPLVFSEIKQKNSMYYQIDASFKECIMGGSIIGTQCVHDFSSTISQEQCIYNPHSAMKHKERSFQEK